jgi:hypothetical protein
LNNQPSSPFQRIQQVELCVSALSFERTTVVQNPRNCEWQKLKPQKKNSLQQTESIDFLAKKRMELCSEHSILAAMLSDKLEVFSHFQTSTSPHHSPTPQIL